MWRYQKAAFGWWASMALATRSARPVAPPSAWSKRGAWRIISQMPVSALPGARHKVAASVLAVTSRMPTGASPSNRRENRRGSRFARSAGSGKMKRIAGSSANARASIAAIPARSAGAAMRTAGGSGSVAAGFFLLGIDADRVLAAFDHVLVDHHFVDAVHRRQIEHRVEQDALEDRAQSARAGLAIDRLLGDRHQRVIGEA